jgi:hypothetical protein
MKSHLLSQKPRNSLLTLVLITLILASFLLTRASAAPAAGYNLDWWTLDAGGGVSAAGNYQLSGGVAQPDGAVMAGVNYQLYGGFWQGTTYFIHLPLVIR